MDDIILRSLRGETAPHEEAELRVWRRSSPANERHYQEIAAISRLATFASASPPDIAPPASELIEQAERRTAAVLETPPVGQRRDRAWRRIRVGAASIGILALGAALYLWWNPGSVGQPHEVVAGPSETTTVALEDGSVVRLAPGSRLRIDQRQSREVDLEGRAFFAIARSPNRPFRVHTRAGEAVVLGTRFELSTEEQGVRLLVVEGHVALEAGAKRVDVRDRQMSRIVGGTIAAPEPVPDVRSRVDWVGQFLVFEATPLPQVIAELERVYDMRVRVLDPALRQQALTGWYSDKTFEEVFTIICSVLDARCAIDDDVATMGAQEEAL